LVIEGDPFSGYILPAHLVGIPVVVNAALAIHRDLKRSENSQAASRRMGGLKADYRVLSVTVARRTCCHF
jgi:predicted histidine transporter YuiF (NhaC family)